MTPAAFAKLSLRMWAAGMLLVYIPSKAMFGIPSIMPVLLSSPTRNTGSLLMAILFAAMIIASLVIWFLADRLALTLLPLGAHTEHGADYAQWERWGLVFFGGWSALKACLAFENLIVDDFYIGDLLSMSFNLIAALILLTGWHNLTGIFSGNRRKDTSNVL